MELGGSRAWGAEVGYLLPLVGEGISDLAVLGTGKAYDSLQNSTQSSYPLGRVSPLLKNPQSDMLVNALLSQVTLFPDSPTKAPFVGGK